MLFEPLVVLVMVVAGLALSRLGRRRLWADLPLAIMLGALIVGGGLSLQAPDGLELQLIVVLSGLVLGEVPVVFERGASLARIRGSYVLATILGLGAYVLRPSAKQWVLLRLSGLLAKVRSGRVGQRELAPRIKDLLVLGSRLRDFATVLELRAGLLPVAVRTQAGERVAATYRAEHVALYAEPPHGGSAAMVSALCQTGRVLEAVELVLAMQAHLEGRQLPPECEAWTHRSAVTVLAHLGRRSSVRAALEGRSPLKALFDAKERKALLDVLKENSELPPALAPEVIETIESRVALAETLASTFSHLLAPAPYTLALVSLNLMFFLVSVSFLSLEEVLLYGGASKPMVLDGEWWRLVAATFLHAHWLHLAMNLVFLLLFGNIVERFVGSGRFLLIYAVSAVVGSLAAVVFGRAGWMVGASGAIFGLVGAAVVLLRAKRVQLPEPWYRRNMAWAVGIIVTSTAIGGLVPFISLAAHLGGLAGGALTALLLVRLEPLSWTPRWTRRAFWAVRGFALALLGFSLVGFLGSTTRPFIDQLAYEDRELHIQEGPGTFVVSAPWFLQDPETRPRKLGPFTTPLRVMSLLVLYDARAYCPQALPWELSRDAPRDVSQLETLLSRRWGVSAQRLPGGLFVGSHEGANGKRQVLARFDEEGYVELVFALPSENGALATELAREIMRRSGLRNCSP